MVLIHTFQILLLLDSWITNILINTPFYLNDISWLVAWTVGIPVGRRSGVHHLLSVTTFSNRTAPWIKKLILQKLMGAPKNLGYTLFQTLSAILGQAVRYCRHWAQTWKKWNVIRQQICIFKIPPRWNSKFKPFLVFSLAPLGCKHFFHVWLSECPLHRWAGLYVFSFFAKVKDTADISIFGILSHISLFLVAPPLFFAVTANQGLTHFQNPFSYLETTWLTFSK